MLVLTHILISIFIWLTRSRFDSYLFNDVLNLYDYDSVQELEEANEKLAEEKKTWYKSWSDLQQKFDHFKNAVKSIVLIID